MSGKKGGAAAKASQPAAAKKRGGLTPAVIGGAVLAVAAAVLFAHQAGLTTRAPAAAPTRARATAAEPKTPPLVRETSRARAPAEPEDAIGLQARLRPAPAAAASSGADPSCGDAQPECASWAANGECENNPGFMHANCVKACGRCASDLAAEPRATWVLPELPGVDWAALEAADAAADAPSDAELAARCGAVDALLSPHRIPGLHVVCRLAGADALAGARLAVWRDADRSARGGRPSHVFSLPAPAPDGAPAVRSMAELIGAVGARLQFAWRGAQWQPPAWFTPDGARLASLAAVARALAAPGSAACLYEGGQFIWPPGEVGSERSVELPDGQVALIRTLSLLPLVLSIERFLEPDEAAHIIGRAAPHLFKSGVALKDHDLGKQAAEFRTSSQYFLPTEGDPKLEQIDARVQALTRVPITHAEYIQVLRYQRLEHYSAHHDYFDPREYASNAQMRAEVKEGAKNRMATVFFYLSDVAEGGATNFPRAGGAPPPRDFFDCSRGMSVYPRAGKVIIFYSMHPSGELDPLSLHGGCDVLNGTKFSANFWLWNEPYHFASPHRVRALEAYKASALWQAD